MNDVGSGGECIGRSPLAVTRRLTALVALAVAASGALLAVAAGAQGGKSDPHVEGKVALPPGASEVVYCRSCHTSGCPAPHPELVKLTWPAQGRVVLGVVGETTCGTCHRRGFRRASDAFLARDEKGLCGPCHYGAHTLSNVHTTPSSIARCTSCHTRPVASLAQAPTPDTHAMAADIDAECLRCHYDGPVSHPVGMANTKKPARDLPLSADAKITCVTCHVGHGQQDRFGMLLRKDNRRGGLCLSCHDDL